MNNLVQDNKYLLMESYTSVPIGCYFPPKCKDQGEEGGCLFYLILYAQNLEQCLVQSNEPIDWMQFMATTSSCDWGQDGDEARILQEEDGVPSCDMAVQPTLSFIITPSSSPGWFSPNLKQVGQSVRDITKNCQSYS